MEALSIRLALCGLTSSCFSGTFDLVINTLHLLLGETDRFPSASCNRVGVISPVQVMGGATGLLSGAYS